VVFVLRPGEVVLIPRGWWHYAVALDPSVTAMKNFYDAQTNLAALARIAAGVRR
jgi:chloride channel 7